MSEQTATLPAFAGFGIELEYMIVDAKRLSVLPIADQLLRTGGGGNEVRRGLLGWSNELVLHLVELKNPQPVPDLASLETAFQAEIRYINQLLESHDARLMPGAMHPWMNPRAETRIWPHDNADIYQAYARIFDCNSHGWANLQSMHINLPFADDEQFSRLHAAVRLVLPILPALAASSPLAEGKDTGFADYRMEVYRSNAQAFPAIAGKVIPEVVDSRDAYERHILQPMYRAIAAHDPDGVLQREWLNSRGAIPRFDRNAIEIRVVDVQECPRADLAIAAAAIAVTRKLYDADLSGTGLTQALPTDMLAAMLQECSQHAEQAQITEAAYLSLFGYPASRCSAGQLWQHLLEQLLHAGKPSLAQWREPLQAILRHGPLAQRIRAAVGGDCAPARLHQIYRQLCECLQQGKMFIPS